MVTGTPGTVAPTVPNSGVTMQARYQRPGALNPRCGSLARIGLPVAVRLPSSTQALEALSERSSRGTLAARCRHSSAGRRLLACVGRSEEHTSELQSLMRISYAVFCLKKKNIHTY